MFGVIGISDQKKMEEEEARNISDPVQGNEGGCGLGALR